MCEGSEGGAQFKREARQEVRRFFVGVINIRGKRARAAGQQVGLGDQRWENILVHDDSFRRCQATRLAARFAKDVCIDGAAGKVLARKCDEAHSGAVGS